MSITVTVTLSNAQAEAVLRSDGLHNVFNGWVSRKSKVLRAAEKKLLDAIQFAWNESLEDK